MDVMQEVLSRTMDPKAPLEEQEFYELRIDDSADILPSCFLVVQAHAKWKQADQRIEWDETEFEQCDTLEQAKHRYEMRRLRLVERGFIYSDMDPLV